MIDNAFQCRTSHGACLASNLGGCRKMKVAKSIVIGLFYQNESLRCKYTRADESARRIYIYTVRRRYHHCQRHNRYHCIVSLSRPRAPSSIVSSFGGGTGEDKGELLDRVTHRTLCSTTRPRRFCFISRSRRTGRCFLLSFAFAVC